MPALYGPSTGVSKWKELQNWFHSFTFGVVKVVAELISFFPKSMMVIYYASIAFQEI